MTTPAPRRPCARPSAAPTAVARPLRRRPPLGSWWPAAALAFAAVTAPPSGVAEQLAGASEPDSAGASDRPISAAAAAATTGTAAAPIHVVLITERGPIVIALAEQAAPRTVANFLRYVDAGLYNGGIFHRTVTREPDNQPRSPVKIEVIQASMDPTREATAALPTIPLERTNATGLAHLDGTVSMARDEPDSASHELFICVGDQPELDFGGRRNPDGQGFGAFGRVVRGMDVVRAIHRAPADGQVLAPAIVIREARRLTAAELAATPLP